LFDGLDALAGYRRRGGEGKKTGRLGWGMREEMD
jgi:hypothetical protein